MKKINILFVLLYLVAGISFGFVFGIILVFLEIGQLGQAAAGLDVIFGNDTFTNLFQLFLLILVIITPVSIYLARFYGKMRIVLMGVIISVILTVVVSTFWNRKSINNTDIIEITPHPANAR